MKVLGRGLALLVIKRFVPLFVAEFVGRTFHLRQVLSHVTREAASRWSSAKRLRHLADVIRTVSAAQTHVLDADVD